MSPAITRWWWVRHAPVPGAEAGRIFGAMDVGCDVSDVAAFERLARALPVDAAPIVTPLRRTAETWEAIARARASTAVAPGPSPIIEPAFAEQSFGRWQGLSWPEMEAADPAAYRAFWRNPTAAAPPEGESFEALIARASAAIERLIAERAGCDLIAVAHGGTVRAALALALGLEPRAALAIVIDNLSLTTISRIGDAGTTGGGAWRVEGVNWPAG